MATEIQEGANAVLKVMVEWTEADNDPNVGRYQVFGPELQSKLGISPARINDAVAYLVNQGYLEHLRTMGTALYDFREVWLTIDGRVAYQETQVGHPVELGLTAIPVQCSPHLVY